MQINFCSASFFFNNSQKYPFVVYDFREQLNGYLKNTIQTQYVGDLASTADLEKHLIFPDLPSEKKKLQTLFKNRKRNFNFFVLYASSDMFTIYLNEQLRNTFKQVRLLYIKKSNDKYSISEDTLYEWCDEFQKKYMKQQKRQSRAQTVKVKQEQQYQNPEIHQQSHVNLDDVMQIQSTAKIAMEYESHENQKQVQIRQRSSSAPHKLMLDSDKQLVSNFELFTMSMCVYHHFKQEKFQSVYILLEPLDIIFREYPFLNYQIQRNKFFLDKQFPNEILENQLYLGAAEHAKDVEMLEDQLKITHILNVTIEVKNYSDKMKYCNIKIYDEHQVIISDHFDEAFEFIDQAINTGGKVLVHCAQGKSRSACMVTMYLMKKFGWEFEKAYDFVKEKRELVQINDGFQEQLEQLDRKLMHQNKMD